MKKVIILSFAIILASCSTPSEKSAGRLARRIVPQYASRIDFEQIQAPADSFRVSGRSGRLLVQGSDAGAMAAGLGRWLRDCCGVDISWERVHGTEFPMPMPLPDSTMSSRALAAERFFLNYCTYGYAMPWWQWDDWEHFIDWMALLGLNMPLAQTGQEAVLLELWKEYGIPEEDILAWFTGPAHLPWHRMCNVDRVDGPLPRGWIEGQKALQKRILRRERELGMHPVLPAFNGHVPPALKDLHPGAAISRVNGWAGFPEENMPCFLSPTDSLFGEIQRKYLEIQEREYGSDHIYGFDLFNEVDPPSWDPATLASMSKEAYGSIAAADPDARWLQMGWMFWYDRKHWTPEIIEAYLRAVPQGKVTILDYYTEMMPVWTVTDSFYGQPFIFCYLGNFGGNTRLAVPFREESGRITDALGPGGAAGLGCTLEGFGLKRWFCEYVMDRAWAGGLGDDEWLAALDRRRHSPEGFWKEMADSVLTRPAINRGPLLCVRPRMAAGKPEELGEVAAADLPALATAWKRLLDAQGDGDAWRYDAVSFGTQALGYLFAVQWRDFCKAYREGEAESAATVAASMRELLQDIERLAACEPSFSMERWTDAASSWGRSPEEEEYYRHNAWLLLTRWGDPSRLGDYACRLWSGLVKDYYAPRWEMFLDAVLADMQEGREFDATSFGKALDSFELAALTAYPADEESHGHKESTGPEADAAGLCNALYDKWLGAYLFQ